MNYEKLDNQNSNSRESIKFLPRSMRDSLLRASKEELKHRNWTIDLKGPILKQSHPEIFHKDLVVTKVRNPDTKGPRVINGLGLAPIDHSKIVVEQKRVALAFGGGTISLIILAYILCKL